MYEQLSKRVDGVIKLANQIARQYELEYVGTEHVLLAIGKEGTGLGAAILGRHGITHDKLKAAVDKLIQASLEDTWVFGRLPGTPHFRNVVALAIEEARNLKSREVCTEHLLLGLLDEKGCVAQKALREFGLTAKQVREDILAAQTKSESQG
ncbi:MAG TPA: Clp protease N-terminal domain-containing protein [Phycisphaerae bacterium]|nr:Clp protease N-terminal domain-containing protein [Phycisphaerae bacterium]